ncbi:sigma-70 region 4 domain-containing protein, partial [bacterium]|nr:sigma-70 region 4 domain-containing protein [bacterium]
KRKSKKKEKAINKNLNKRFVWTPEKDEFLLKSYSFSNKEIAEKLQTSVASVKGRLRRLRAKGSNIKFKNRCFTWTKSKDDILIKNYRKSTNELADLLNTSVSLIENRLLELSKQGLIPEDKKKLKSR